MNLIRSFAYALVLLLVFIMPFYTHSYIPLGFFIALTIISFLDIIKARTIRFIWQEAAFLLILIMAIAYAALDISYIELSTIRLVFYYGMPLLMLLCIRRVWIKRIHWLWLGGAYLQGCVVSSTIIVGTWITEGIEAGKRLSVGDINTNYISYSLALGVFVGLTLIIFSKNKILSNILIGVIALFVLGIILSGTRGAIISVVALLFSYYSIHVGFRSVKILLYLITSIVLGNLLLGLLPESIYFRIFNASTEDVSSGRYELWSRAVSYILTSPIVGHGLGYFQSNNLSGSAVHNVFLSVLVEFGAIGLLLYSFGVFSLVFMKSKYRSIVHTRWLFIISWLPIAMTGVWEFSITMWFVYAWISHIPLPSRSWN